MNYLPGRYISKENEIQMYMSLRTGEVSDYDGWHFEDDGQVIQNWVNLSPKEIIPVIWEDETWKHGKVKNG
jgi:hypothetical protein